MMSSKSVVVATYLNALYLTYHEFTLHWWCQMYSIVISSWHSLHSLSLVWLHWSALLWFRYSYHLLLLFQVYNFIPSISAITGIQPGRYVWRICIALHSAPRFAVGYIYYNYYLSRLHLIAPSQHSIFKRLASTAFWVYTVENFCLVFVAYISNVENYRKYSFLSELSILYFFAGFMFFFAYSHFQPSTKRFLWYSCSHLASINFSNLSSSSGLTQN